MKTELTRAHIIFNWLKKPVTNNRQHHVFADWALEQLKCGLSFVKKKESFDGKLHFVRWMDLRTRTFLEFMPLTIHMQRTNTKSIVRNSLFHADFGIDITVNGQRYRLAELTILIMQFNAFRLLPLTMS